MQIRLVRLWQESLYTRKTCFLAKCQCHARSAQKLSRFDNELGEACMVQQQIAELTKLPVMATVIAACLLLWGNFEQA